MKGGDYMIHFLIQQTRNMKLDGRYEDSVSNNIRDVVDPIIEITCLNNKKFSSSKKAIGPLGVVHWGEHIFFEPKKLVRTIR